MRKSNYANLLRSTFMHLNGINQTEEYELWKNGITNIEQLQNKYCGHLISLFDGYGDFTTDTQKALKEDDVEFFASKLPSSEFFRIALTYYSKIIFIDIETTGLSKRYSYITMIGWTFNGQYKYMLKGESPAEFLNDLAQSKIVITFNGTLFDIPFIKSVYRDIVFPKVHIDLRFFSRRYSYTGGQKKIECDLNVNRPEYLGDVDGKEAVVLWYKYLSGNLNSVKKLIRYNYYDVLGMQKIFDAVVSKHIEPYWPEHKMPFYKFSRSKVVCKIRSLENSLEKTKKSIKNYNLYQLLAKTKQDIKVIGIDLTGSEKKPSGCCLLENNKADTCLIKTDDELIDYVMKNNPQVVSIDSPLSLPVGRKTVSDNDMGRQQYGIMRYCERELKRRGVNVYPCLIPSMQNLTARGMTLAKRLRKLGIPVIESFPGAAQDVLKIPRKKTAMYFLKKGLIEFGISGSFEKKKISHDELDAITSALVGTFFMCNQYEGIGNKTEGYLIIPNLEKSNIVSSEKIIIGFSGEIAAGKTTAAEVLKKRGAGYVRFSQVISKMLKKENKENTRYNLQKLGEVIHCELGQYWLCEELLKIMPDTNVVVIDGLRHPEDYTFFREHFGSAFQHIFISADVQVRKKRYKKYVDEEISDVNLDKIFNHPVEANSCGMKMFANRIVENNGTKEEFEDCVLKLL